MTKKELTKDVEHAIKWLAAEFKFLKKLDEDLKRIEERDMQYDLDKMKLNKDNRILDYIGKCEVVVNNDVEKTIHELREARGKNSSSNKISKILEEIEVPAAVLLRDGSRYLGNLKEQLKSIRTNVQLQKKHKEDSYGRKELKKKIEALEIKVSKLLGWIVALDVALKKAKNLGEGKTYSQIFAEEKLNEIISDNFFDYGVRCVNRDEFFEILGKGSLFYNEIYLPNFYSNVISTKKYIAEEFLGFKEWSQTASIQTSWPFSTKLLQFHSLVNYVLKDCSSKAKDEGLSRKEKRRRMFELFLERMMKEYDYYMEHLDDTLIKFKKKLGRYNQSGFGLSKRLESFSDKNRNRFNEILKDHKLLEVKGNFEFLISFLGDVVTLFQETESSAYSQYHLFLIVKKGSGSGWIKGEYSFPNEHYGGEWGVIGEPQNDGSRLLAVICVVNDRKLLKQVIEASSKAGQWSCPIISRGRTVQYPRRLKIK